MSLPDVSPLIGGGGIVGLVIAILGLRGQAGKTTADATTSLINELQEERDGAKKDLAEEKAARKTETDELKARNRALEDSRLATMLDNERRIGEILTVHAEEREAERVDRHGRKGELAGERARADNLAHDLEIAHRRIAELENRT